MVDHGSERGPGRRFGLTQAIAIVTAATSLWVLLSGTVNLWALRAGFVPARWSLGLDIPDAVPFALSPLTTTLVHGGALHLGFNLLMLVVVGRHVEAVLGRRASLLTYLLGAYIAVLVKYWSDPATSVPLIGASGAISAWFGLYAMLYSRPKRLTGDGRLDRAINALWLLAAWIALQYASVSLMGPGAAQVDIVSHIGGFAGGLALYAPLMWWRRRAG